METVERLCDAIALIHRGRKVLEGPVSEVKSRHGKNTIVLAYEGDGAFLAALPGVQKVSDFGRYVEIRMADGADPQAHPARGGGPPPRQPLRGGGAEPPRHLRGAGDGGGRGGGVMRMAIVARREYLERVRSKAFVVSTFLGPLLLVGFLLGPTMLMERQRGKPLRVTVIDATGTHDAARSSRPWRGGRSRVPPRFVLVPVAAARRGSRRARQARRAGHGGRASTGISTWSPTCCAPAAPSTTART